MALKVIQINMSKEMIDGIDIAIKLGYATNRSEFIRMAVGEKLKDLSIISEMKKRRLK